MNALRAPFQGWRMGDLVVGQDFTGDVPASGMFNAKAPYGICRACSGHIHRPRPCGNGSRLSAHLRIVGYDTRVSKTARTRNHSLNRKRVDVKPLQPMRCRPVALARISARKKHARAKQISR